MHGLMILKNPSKMKNIYTKDMTVENKSTHITPQITLSHNLKRT